jgi:hypothetical protein
MLVYSVIKIRNFFRDKGDEQYIDSEGLCRHATCFITYVVFQATYYTFY